MSAPPPPPPSSRKFLRSLIAAVPAFALAPIGAAAAQERDDPALIALPPVVVSASRVPIDATQVGSSTTVITSKQLEDAQTRYAVDALRLVPGVAVNQSGAVGSLTQVRLRGAEGNHVLVMIDGVEASNVGDGEYAFGSLLAADIDRIEVLRGPQSAVWGANALSGVINIVTKRPRVGGEIELEGEGGTTPSSFLRGALRANNGKAWASLTGAWAWTEGENISRFGNEDDGNRNVTGAFKGGAAIGDDVEIEAVGRIAQQNNQADPANFNFGTPNFGLVVDGSSRLKSLETLGKVEGRVKSFDGAMQTTARVAANGAERDNYLAGVNNGGTDAYRLNVSLTNAYDFDTPGFADGRHTLIGYGEYKREIFRNDFDGVGRDQRRWRDRNLYGFAGEYRGDFFDRLSMSGALRYDFNDEFDDAFTWRATASYRVLETGTRVHSSIGKGVTNPTFVEQFGFFPNSFDGNPDLEPEHSIGWDVGVEQSLFNDRLIVDVTWFQAKLDDEIISTFDAATGRSSVDNRSGKSQRRGVEVAVTARPLDNLDLNASFTWTDSEERGRDGKDNREVRRPRYMGSADATLRVLDDRAYVCAGVVYNGRMRDIDPSAFPKHVNLDDYVLLDVAAGYQVTEGVELFARVENALDDDHEEVFSYESPGIAGYAGLRVKLGAYAD